MAEELSILQRYDTGCARWLPFPHVIIDDALPQPLYDELVASYPPPELIFAHQRRRRRERHMRSNWRYDINAATLLTQPSLVCGPWHDFVTYHTSQAFLDEVFDKLGDLIGAAHPDLEDQLRARSPSARPRAGIRRLKERATDCEVALDCQLGMNSPVVGAPSAVKGPHLDSNHELYAGLFYLRDSHDTSEGGDLELFHWRGEGARFAARRHVRHEDVIRAAVIPYAANRFVWLLNGLDAVHAVSVRRASTHPRRLVNIIAELYPSKITLFDERPYQSAWGRLRHAWQALRRQSGRTPDA